ncbi:MAG: hypothetical protein ACI4XC_05720 [Eubacterium sp.]
MKNKKIQIPIIVIACIIALAGVYKLLDSVCYPFVEAKAENYLCEKYDAQPEEFELIDYNQAHLFWEEYKIFFQKPIWIDFSFEFEYNDRLFIVCRDEDGFYDDYQFEDIELWCTEWLQENVDKRIIGFDFKTNDILTYLKTTNINYAYVLSKNDAKDFLMNYNVNKKYSIFFYYDPKGPGYYGINEELGETIKNVLGCESECTAEYLQEKPVRVIDKFKEDKWESYT